MLFDAYMLRSNVLRRGTSFAIGVCSHVLNHIRWYASSAGLPVAHDEFWQELQHVLKARWNAQSMAPVGFAISGGVDSMALAALYSQARNNEPQLPRAHGLIVDHRLRPESTDEANWVAEQLRLKFGMDATILPLVCPSSFDLSDSRRLETEARRLRYQALGTACRQKGITALMVAHHADDQAETVLMRLANNRLRSGLQAMQSVEWIPECEGMYGVYHSGAPARIDLLSTGPLGIEQGGIQVLRPLLSLPKSRLIATCEEKSVLWAEDKTNQIQTLTARNAIRHIYRHHKLPKALGVESLVNLSRYMQKRVDSHKAYAEKLFYQCSLQLHIQTGSLFVKFPPYSALLERPIGTDSDRNEARNNAYCLIKRVAEMVSPRTSAPLDKLAAAIDNIYPEFVLNSPHAAYQSRTNFSVFGVWWRAWNKPSAFVRKSEGGIGPALSHLREWHLMRQPLAEYERANATYAIVYPRSSNLPATAIKTYQLFDGRFWIHLRNLTSSTLVLRPFTNSDYIRFSAETDKGVHNNAPTRPSPRFLAAALDILKPWDLRLALPAVFCKDSTTGEETLLGFPTLHLHDQGFSGPLDSRPCEWDVRYKKIDFGKRKPAEIVVASLSRREIEAQERRQRQVREGSARQSAKAKTKTKTKNDRASDAESSEDWNYQERKNMESTSVA